VQIFLLFSSLSLLSIGGGNSVLPEMHRQSVGEYHWLTDNQFADVFAISGCARSQHSNCYSHWLQSSRHSRRCAGNGSCYLTRRYCGLFSHFLLAACRKITFTSRDRKGVCSTYRRTSSRQCLHHG